MLTSKSRILPSTFYSDTVSRSRIRRQCLVELKEEPVPVSEDFGSIRVLMKYFPAHGPANKERSRSFEGSALHKKNEIRVPDWISVPLSPNLGGYFFTSSERGAEPDHIQVSRSLQLRYRKSSQWIKKIFT